jgi:hypothetical protein
MLSGPSTRLGRLLSSISGIHIVRWMLFPVMRHLGLFQTLLLLLWTGNLCGRSHMMTCEYLEFFQLVRESHTFCLEIQRRGNLGLPRG